MWLLMGDCRVYSRTMTNTQPVFVADYECATTTCHEARVGKSKYCRMHRDEARRTWAGKVKSSCAERDQRYAEFSEAWTDAKAAGHQAALSCSPTPMRIAGYEPVADGMCGFAWVTVVPGNCSFAKWAVKNADFRSAYGGGVQFWVGAYNQSYERKMAFATKAACVLSSRLGILVHSGGRLD